MWTKTNTNIYAHDGTTYPLIDRTVNTAVLTLSKDEALALVYEITRAFGIGGVPTEASFTKIHVVIENPNGFYPQDMEISID